jgi:hypothetical protein
MEVPNTLPYSSSVLSCAEKVLVLMIRGAFYGRIKKLLGQTIWIKLELTRLGDFSPIRLLLVAHCDFLKIRCDFGLHTIERQFQNMISCVYSVF